MDTQEIKKMSRIERLQAMEALWDSLEVADDLNDGKAFYDQRESGVGDYF